MLYALGYERVSTQEQADANNSVPAQRRRIEAYAAKNGITILEHYVDAGASASKDDERREAFWQMIERAKADPQISLILVDDALRFYRNKAKAVMIKADLRAHGVQVRSVSLPYDPTTLHGLWLEAIDETRAQAGAMEIAFNTIRGMEQNAMTRDPETGWCYKNGGRPPYGYEAYHRVVARTARGRDIVRTLWRINEEQAKVVRLILVTLRGEQELSYDDIRDELNRRGIPSPNGGMWSTSCIYELCREERILQYAGTYFWNKEDHKTIGRRFKPKDQWIRVDNAHPAIITQEEAERAIALNRKRHRERPKLWTRKLNYLLSGDNIFGEPLFRCVKCGGRMVGHNPNPGRAARKYICSTAINKGPLACVWKGVPVDALEQELITRIVQSLNDAELERYTQALREACAEERRDFARQQAIAKGRLREIEQELNRLLTAVAKGLDEELAIRKINALKEEHMELQRTVAAIEKAADELSISLDQIRVTRDSMRKTLLQSDDIEMKRKYIAGVISYMEYDPDTDNITVHLFPDAVAILNVATPKVTRVADVRFGTGARDRTWVLKRTALTAAPAATAGHRYEQREVRM